MGDAVSSDPPATEVEDEGALERRRLVLVAVGAAVALVVALLVVWNVARPATSSSSGSSAIAIPSPDPTLDGSGAGDLSACEPEQDDAIAEVQGALPWATTVTGSSSSTQGDGTCLGPMLQVVEPYETVVAAVPDALAGAGILVTLDGGDASSSTFTGTSATGQSIGIFVADDQGVGSVIGITVAPPSAG